MDLGKILEYAANKDLAQNGQNEITYKEEIRVNKEGKKEFHIRLESKVFPESFIVCHIPYSGKLDEENYARTYFLSMLFNSAIYGMKRINLKGKKLKNKNTN